MSNILAISLPETVDLMKLAASLEIKGASKKLTGALRTAWRTQSCLSDLRHAKGSCDSIDALFRVRSQFDDSSYQHLRNSAFVTSIILYARATSTSSGKKNERGSVNLDVAKLAKNQREDHDLIIRLRNSALAHVERSSQIHGESWHKDFLFAKRSSLNNWEVASASLSIGFLDRTLDALKRQIPIASEELEKKCRERLNGAIHAIRELNLVNLDLERYRVDPIEWFGGYHAAKLALGAEQGEEVIGWLPLI